MRQPKNHEMLCKFGCKTIVTKELKSCEMCCALAVSERAERLAPIIAESQRLAEEKSERLRARFEPKSEPTENTPEIAEPEIVEPAPKRRGRPAKEV